MNKKLLYILTLCLPLTMACTDVELCDESTHPHEASVKFTYDWQHITSGNSAPDSMKMLGERIVNARKYAMQLSALTGTGKTLYTEDPDTTVTNPNNISAFKVRTGSYRWLTYNEDNLTFDFDALNAIEAEKQNSWQMEALNLKYRSFKKESSEVTAAINDWEDFNAYSDFVVTTRPTIYAGGVDLVDIGSGESKALTLTPTPITHAITLTFDVVKDSTDTIHFKIDSIKTEIAGIPEAVELYNRHLNISNTYKTIVETSMMNLTTGTATDDTTNHRLRCTATLNATGIMGSKTADELTGAGIMQVVIYATTDSMGIKVRKMYQGKINLHNSLLNAAITTDTGYGYAESTLGGGTVWVESQLLLNSNGVVEEEKEPGYYHEPITKDKWIACKNTTIE
jgi:hypothetical protein